MRQEMEFVSEEEKIEYMNIHGNDIYVDEYPKKQKEEKYLIAAVVNGAYLYVGEPRYTYNYACAKVFPLSEAINKIKFMNKRGKYLWEKIKC